MLKSLLTTLIVFAASVGSGEAQTRLIPLEDLARAPAVVTVTISPDGETLGIIEMQDGRGAVVVQDIETGARQALYRNPERSLGNLAWSADGRWLLTFQDAGGDEGYHLFRIDPQAPGADPVDLTPFQGVQAELVRLPPDRPGVALITLNRRDPELADAYSVDLSTGALTEEARNEIGFTEFQADARGRVLAGAVTRSDGTLELLARNDTSGPWRVVYTAPADERFKLMALSPNGRTAVVRSNRGRETERVLGLNLGDGAVNPLTSAGCGRFDEDAVVLDRTGRPAFGVCVTERASVTGLTPAAARQIARVRRLVGPDASLFLDGSTPDLRTSIYFSDQSDRPGRFILFRNGRATVLAEHRPVLVNQAFSPSTHHWLKARDGLDLSVYVTASGGSGPRPTVISLHGGPWSRDTAGFEPDVQLLANRGYTVLQVNFRGSTGLGRRHFEAGVKQFGRAMSDDVIDALDWAIREGISDPDRVCVMGGSYGGYATLVALTRDAARFRCGVDFAGPADLITLVEAFPPSWRPFLPRSWFRFVGDPSVAADRADMASRSPLASAERIVAPLLIFQGANDPRVTQAQSDQIVCALRRRSVPVTYLLAGNEGHSFGNEETALAVNRAMEAFFSDHLGGRAQATVDDGVQAALDGLSAAGDDVACPAAPAPAD